MAYVYIIIDKNFKNNRCSLESHEQNICFIITLYNTEFAAEMHGFILCEDYMFGLV